MAEELDKVSSSKVCRVKHLQMPLQDEVLQFIPAIFTTHFKRKVANIGNYTLIPSLNYTLIPSLNYTLIPSLNYTLIPSLNYTLIPSLNYTLIPFLNYTLIPSLNYTLIPFLHYTLIPFLHYTLIPFLNYTLIPFLNHTLIPFLHYTLIPFINLIAPKFMLLKICSSFICNVLNIPTQISLYVSVIVMMYCERVYHRIYTDTNRLIITFIL